MNPEQLGNVANEHMQQAAVFCWAAMACNKGFAVANDMAMYSAGKQHIGIVPVPIPELKWMHAIPNAGARGNAIAASQLKAEGVKSGVADIFLPVRRKGVVSNTWLPGMYIEMKRLDGNPNDVTKEQQEFREFVESQGYIWVVAFGWRMAVDYIQRYMSKPL